MGDHLTCTGQFHGVDHTGMAKREDSFLTQASLERSSGIFIKYSLGGSEETTDYISPATILGGKPTGLNTIVHIVDSEIASEAAPVGKELLNDEIGEVASKSLKALPAMFLGAPIAPLEAWIPQCLGDKEQQQQQEVGEEIIRPPITETGPHANLYEYRAVSPPSEYLTRPISVIARAQEEINTIPEQC